MEMMQRSPDSDQTTENPESPNKEVIFNIEGKEIKLEYRTSFFEYPESIQKETGILGYERKTIPEDDLLKALRSCLSENQKKIIKKKIGFDINSISTLEQLQEFMKSSEGKLDYEVFTKSMEDFSKNLLMAMTNKQFPSESFNYVMGGSREERQQFTEDKFLLQDIFGFESYQDLSQKVFINTIAEQKVILKQKPCECLLHISLK